MLGTGLVMKWLLQYREEQELGIHFAGAGLGIVVSALIVGFSGEYLLGGLGWRGQWLTLAACGMVLSVPANCSSS